MRVVVLGLLLVAMVTVPVRRAEAQSQSVGGLRASAAQLSASAELRAAAAGPVARPMLAMDSYRHGTRREGTALMIVGVAAIVTGLIVDESVVTILGAGAGGVGLYLYLR